ncbi:MAG: hypothetical protein IPM94_11255 [bacterium]|nr:hypothetical protein [bacterium]
MADSRIPSSSPVPTPEPTGCLGVIVRLSWLAIGPALLFALTFKIGDTARFSGLDILFWVVAAGMVVVRYLDIARLGGQTANCEPAGMRDWRRYAVAVPVVAGVLWALAHTLLVGFMR